MARRETRKISMERLPTTFLSGHRSCRWKALERFSHFHRVHQVLINYLEVVCLFHPVEANESLSLATAANRGASGNPLS